MGYPPKTIGVCGFSATGSSAVIDLLKEYEGNSVVDECEMILPYAPDGLCDLRYQLFEGAKKFTSSNTATYRFLRANRRGQFRYIRELTGGRLAQWADEFVEAVVQCTWIGSSPPDQCYHPVRDILARGVQKAKLGCVFALLDDLAGRDVQMLPMGRMRFSSSPSGFDEAARVYIRKVLVKLGADFSKNVVLDQPFPGNNPAIAFPFFEDPIAIVVDRDPRDYYLLCKEYYRRKLGWRAVPSTSVEDFVTYFKGMREDMPYHADDQRVLSIKLEDLIYRYDETVHRIMDFCGLKNHNHPKRYFDPAESVNNTQLIRDYPQYADDVAYIEKHLQDYLFPFEDYQNVVIDRSKMFDEKPKEKLSR